MTRKFLSALGIDADKIDEIITAHTETVDGLKGERDKYKADAEKLTSVQKELDTLKANSTDDYKDKYEKEHSAFEKYKSEINAKETAAAKESAVKAYFEGKNISGKNLEIAMRACGAEISALELEDGKIKDTKTLDDLVGGTFSGLVCTTQTMGAKTNTPPANGHSEKKWTKADVMKISDTSERQKAWCEFIEQERNN